MIDPKNLKRAEKEELYLALLERDKRRRQRKLYTYYPDEGPLSWQNYPKHMEFFEAGAEFRERCFMAGNRTGKTEGAGAYELVCHAIGAYPKWWKGKKFDRPVNCVAAGVTGKETRDVIQGKLLGKISDIGTGMIPGKLIDKMTTKPGIPDAKDQVWVKHSRGGISEITLMSYDQGREAFQGTERDVVWLDEEPPLPVYTECVIRTMTTNGTVMLTFTPLLGISEVVMLFMPDGAVPT